MITMMKSLLIAAACLMAGASAQASDFAGRVTQYPTSNYASDAISFSLIEVAGKLDTDTATLAQALRTYIQAEAPDPLLFSIIGTTGAELQWTDATKADANGFWMDADGLPVAWGENSVWFASPSVDGAEDLLAFYVGQMPNVMNAGDAVTTEWKLTLDGKSTTFQLGLSVVEKPTFDVPEPVVIEGQLAVLGEKEIVVEQYPRGDYSADAVRVSLEGVGALLDIPDMTLLENQIGDVVYTTWYNDGDIEEGGGMKKDSLTNVPTGEGHGFWYHAVQNEDGEEDGEVAASGWGNTDKFYLNNFTYTTATDSLTCQLGQYPGVCKDNETWFAYVYIIYGEKAYRIKYTLKLMEMEQGSGLANYTKVGEASVTVEQEPTDDYATVTVKPDMEAIAAALGCEISAVGMAALDDKDNFGNSTANNGGFWFSDAGTVVAWGANSVMFIEPLNSNDYSVLSVGQYPSYFSIGDEASASIYFMNGTNYYQYTVNLKIVEPQLVEHGFKSVATRAALIQTLPSASEYPISATYEISLEDIEALIGTSSPTLYGLNNDSVAAIKGQYSNAYSCDPKPGFWLEKDGYVSIWGDPNARVGICYANGSFQFFQYPGRNSVGDNFKTTLFLVNVENEQMITINFIVSFVDKLNPVEIVGSENIRLPLTSDNEAQVKIDVQKACEALDITVDDLLNPNNYYLRGLTSEGIFGETSTADNGLSFAMDGSYDSYGDIMFTMMEEDGEVYIVIYCNEEVDDDFSVDGQFCIEVNDLRYIYYVKFLSPALYEKGDNIKGDVNGDNKVDVADITQVIAVMAAGGFSDAADVNGDGRVDVADISQVISIMASNARALRETVAE